MSEHPPILKRLYHALTGQDASSASIRESLEEVIEESERESPAISAQERVMLGNLLRFGDLRLTLGLENILNKEPPLDYTGVGYNQGLVGRPGGRFGYAAVRRSF